MTIEFATARRTVNVWLLRLAPLAGGIAAIALAAIAEAQIRATGSTLVSALLYIAAGILFAVSGAPQPPAEADLGDSSSIVVLPARRARIIAWTIGLAGIAIAVGLGFASFQALRQNIKSASGFWLWIAAMAVLTLTAALATRPNLWPARWGSAILPRSFGSRAILRYALVALFVLSALARLLWLDRLPISINRDEGDRAGRMAVAIARGFNTIGFFESGWYYISNVYFTLLAGFMKIVGLGFAQARLFHALVSLATVGVVTVTGIRHFGWRVGVLAGGVLSLLAIGLQFARVTTESTPTALCWAISMLCFYEAHRRGKLWAWALAGILGGLSIYFYPMGRMWAVLAALWCIYVFIRGPHRARIALGAAIAAAGALIVVAPYFANIWNKFHELTLRFDQTTALNVENAARLVYYNPKWTTIELLLAQLQHSLFSFNQFGDGGGFYPTREGVAQPLTAMLILIGIGSCLVRWRDPRIVALSLWFWTGIVGMIVTVETPSVQRMGTAIPALGLIIAVVLDSIARRIELAGASITVSRPDGDGRPDVAPTPEPGAARGVAGRIGTAVALLAAGAIMVSEGGYYFGVYAKNDYFLPWNAEGHFAAAEGPNTIVMALGRAYHLITAGWVDLVAVDTPHAGVRAPGSVLPLALPPDKSQTFYVYPEQGYVLPYLRQLYPAASTVIVTDMSKLGNPGRVLFTAVRVPREVLAATRGARATLPSGASQTVLTLGAVPRGLTSFPADLSWSAGLRVEQYANYAFRVGPGPARLTIGGREILSVPDGQPARQVVVSLARGDHAVRLDATLAGASAPNPIEWARVSDTAGSGAQFGPVARSLLDPEMSAPRGLAGTVRYNNALQGQQLRLDNALFTCCLFDETRAEGRMISGLWLGSLLLTKDGEYEFSLTVEGEATLKIDGATVIEVDTNGGTRDRKITLAAGQKPIEVVVKSLRGTGGLELIWKPPASERSVIPPSALTPPPGAGISDPVSPAELGRQAEDVALDWGQAR